jgi:Protein of unknown function (DUF4238)
MRTSPAEPNTYPTVRHSHIVPQGYLRSWREPDGIVMRLLREDVPSTKVISVRDAAVRRRYYRRRRPGSGVPIDDIEWSLSQLEDRALPLVKDIAELWPPSTDQKSGIAQYIAAQYLRGEAYTRWHSDLFHSGARPDVEPTLIAEVIAMDRPMRLLVGSRSAGTLLASMRWQLICFPRPRLITSDEPVIAWPLQTPSARRPARNEIATGIGMTLEVFMPMTPTALLLMTWEADVDGSTPRRGLGRHADTANAFLRANAQRQWFHLPSVRPTLASGARAPLSATFSPRYDAIAAARSSRRTRAVELALEEAERGPSNEPLYAIPMTAAA